MKTSLFLLEAKWPCYRIFIWQLKPLNVLREFVLEMCAQQQNCLMGLSLMSIYPSSRKLRFRRMHRMQCTDGALCKWAKFDNFIIINFSIYTLHNTHIYGGIHFEDKVYDSSMSHVFSICHIKIKTAQPHRVNDGYEQS